MYVYLSTKGHLLYSTYYVNLNLYRNQLFYLCNLTAIEQLGPVQMYLMTVYEMQPVSLNLTEIKFINALDLGKVL